MSDRPNGKAHDKGNGDGDGTVRILLLEDSKTDVQLIEHELKRSELPTSIQVVENREDFEQRWVKSHPKSVKAGKTLNPDDLCWHHEYEPA